MCILGRPETNGQKLGGLERGRGRADDQSKRPTARAVRRARCPVALLQRGFGRYTAADHHRAGHGGPNRLRGLVERRRLRGYARQTGRAVVYAIYDTRRFVFVNRHAADI